MSQLQQQLREAATKNDELLAVLRESEYAGPALKQNASYIADLKSQIANTDKTINQLHQSTEKERKEHVKIRDSLVRRYASKLQGSKGQEKFTAKQDKEEREFVDAWQKEREAQERREELGRALEQAEKEKKSLESDVKSHDQAQKDLDQLYQRIFSGPTPDVPGEDDMEQAVERSKEHFRECEEQFHRNKNAADALNEAQNRLRSALANMQDALSASNVDRFGGGALFDLMERDAMSKAQMNLNWTLRVMAEATRAQPAIEPLREVAIDHGHALGDIFFDNIFSDFAQHERIQSSTVQMQHAYQHLQQIIATQKQRLQDAQSRQKEATHSLLEARTELQRIRSEAFKNLREGNASAEGDPELPAYSA